VTVTHRALDEASIRDILPTSSFRTMDILPTGNVAMVFYNMWERRHDIKESIYYHGWCMTKKHMEADKRYERSKLLCLLMWRPGQRKMGEHM
jgi:hypothetical protein